MFEQDTGSTQEDPSGYDWTIVDWDVNNQNEHIKTTYNHYMSKFGVFTVALHIIIL